MKVVLFCGGMGTRLREHSGTTPKSLVPIGTEPILIHMMKYYAHFGHKDFILCLGFRGDMIREYFLNYNPYLSQDFCMEPGGRILPEKSDISDWRITFVDTGLHSNIGQRLLRVRPYLEGEEMFLANYSDILSDLPMPPYLDAFRASDATAGFIAVRPSASFHCVSVGDGGLVDCIRPSVEANLWINGGYMALRREIFDQINEGEELVEAPFQRLIAAKKLYGHRYEGFWGAMDTFKEKIMFDRMYGRGERPWQVWENGQAVSKTSARPALRSVT